MKKVFKLFIIGCITTISCTSCEKSTNTTPTVKPASSGNSIAVPTYESMEFEYKGHEYIVFNVGLYRAGVVHNPDCRCHHNDSTEHYNNIN